jgi:hypothetical protein
MNWRRGFWRLWIVGSVLWALAVAVLVNISSDEKSRGAYPTPDGHQTFVPWERIWSLDGQNSCAKARQEDTSLGNPFACFEPRKPERMLRGVLPTDAQVTAFLFLALVPSVVALVLGLAVAWIVRGFRRTA